MENIKTYLNTERILNKVVGQNGDIPQEDTEVWVLGKRYNALLESELIRRDVRSRLWCTYRSNFPPLGQSELTSDKGWGCMIRCGQMVLAQALIDLHLGRDWFWTAECRDPTYLQIVNRFEDTHDSSFSLHQIAQMGDEGSIRIGQWFGPNAVSIALQKLAKADNWSSIVIYVCRLRSIIKEEIYTHCLEDANDEDSWKPLFLMIPVSIGLEEVNPCFIPQLKKCFELAGNCGVIGGRPSQALYFIGYVGDELLYLDPHTTQLTGVVGDKTTPEQIAHDQTYHQNRVSRMSFRSLDCTVALCFLCKSKRDFESLLDKLKTEVIDTATNPILEILDSRPTDWGVDFDDELQAEFPHSDSEECSDEDGFITLS